MKKETAEAVLEVTPELLAQVIETVATERELSFTIVHGWVRGDHAKPFELHATGCRDLRSKQAKQLFNYEVKGINQGAAIIAAVDTLAGTATANDIHIQPCCGLKRMRAIGRA